MIATDILRKELIGKTLEYYHYENNGMIILSLYDRGYATKPIMKTSKIKDVAPCTYKEYKKYNDSRLNIGVLEENHHFIVETENGAVFSFDLSRDILLVQPASIWQLIVSWCKELLY